LYGYCSALTHEIFPCLYRRGLIPVLVKGVVLKASHEASNVTIQSYGDMDLWIVCLILTKYPNVSQKVTLIVTRFFERCPPFQGKTGKKPNLYHGGYLMF